MTDPTCVLDVVAALVWRGDELLVTQRPAGSHLAGFWEFPGGKIEPGETPEAALARELREELDLAVQIDRLRSEVVHDYAEKTVRLLFFDCAWIGGEARNVAVAAHRWITRHELTTLTFPPADRELLADLSTAFGPRSATLAL